MNKSSISGKALGGGAAALTALGAALYHPIRKADGLDLAPEPNRHWTQGDTNLMRASLLGGAGVGGSVALLAGLLNQFHTLRADKKEEEEKNELAVQIPLRKKTATAAPAAPSFENGELNPTWRSLAMFVPTTVLGGIGAFHGTKKIYEMLKQRELQKELDAAQRDYQEALAQEQRATKKANAGIKVPYTEADMLKMVAGAGIIIPGLASALLTHKLLDQQFPEIRKGLPTSEGLKPVRLKYVKVEDEELGPDGKPLAKKVASEELDLYPSALLHVANVVMAREKIASISWIPDMVHATALGQHDEVAQAILSPDPLSDASLSLIKGASATPIPRALRNAAIIKLATDKATGPAFKTLLVAEANDMSPWLTKLAGALPEDAQEAIFNITTGCERYLAANELLKEADARGIDRNETEEAWVGTLLNQMAKEAQELQKKQAAELYGAQRI